jgi:hypothetical protein
VKVKKNSTLKCLLYIEGLTNFLRTLMLFCEDIFIPGIQKNLTFMFTFLRNIFLSYAFDVECCCPCGGGGWKMLWRRAVVILRTGTADKSVLSGVPDIDLLLPVS